MLQIIMTRCDELPNRGKTKVRWWQEGTGDPFSLTVEGRLTRKWLT